jgi:ribosomal protein S18 acetylase RimI-like enzyme
MGPTIRPATSDDDLEAIRLLFREYADSLGFDLSFQNFDRDFLELPGPYAPPSGCLLLATREAEPVGCAALKRLAEGIGEMKRLYVRPSARGTGLGRALAEQIVREAERSGYETLRLDTIPDRMGRAVELYRALGFREIPAYYFNPIPGALFMELQLAKKL